MLSLLIHSLCRDFSFSFICSNRRIPCQSINNGFDVFNIKNETTVIICSCKLYCGYDVISRHRLLIIFSLVKNDEQVERISI